VKIFQVLKKHNLKFLMPMQRNYKVKNAFDDAEHTKAKVFNDFKVGKENVKLILVDDFKPRTTTTNYNIRLFYFLFSCCLYNLWVLVNICVSLRIYGRIKRKPIITAKQFTLILYYIQKNYDWYI
jgi:hypothetical protein